MVEPETREGEPEGPPSRQAGGHWFEPSTAHPGSPRKTGVSLSEGQRAGGRARKMPGSALGSRGVRADRQLRPALRRLHAAVVRAPTRPRELTAHIPDRK